MIDNVFGGTLNLTQSIKAFREEYFGSDLQKFVFTSLNIAEKGNVIC